MPALPPERAGAEVSIRPGLRRVYHCSYTQYIVPMSRLRLTSRGVQYQDVMWAVRVPGTKDERRPDSWAVQRKHAPKPLGGVWARIEATNAHTVRTTFMPDVE